MKGALASSSRTLYAAGKNITHSGTERSQQLSVVSSNENMFVRVEISNQIETASLCTVISRPSLELVYAEIAKKLQNQEEEEGTTDQCSCAIRRHYHLPCSHQIQLSSPLDVRLIHNRWRVQAILPLLNVSYQHLQLDVLSVHKDPPVAIPRMGRPIGTRRLQTSAEIVQNTADRVEKVRRCGSCRKVPAVGATADKGGGVSPPMTNAIDDWEKQMMTTQVNGMRSMWKTKGLPRRHHGLHRAFFKELVLAIFLVMFLIDSIANYNFHVLLTVYLQIWSNLRQARVSKFTAMTAYVQTSQHKATVSEFQSSRAKWRRISSLKLKLLLTRSITSRS
ncbi:hypothetical protein V1527DRAFT_479623 [Lipomyces starkeyi]